jgi:hypothetical protein
MNTAQTWVEQKMTDHLQWQKRGAKEPHEVRQKQIRTWEDDTYT